MDTNKLMTIRKVRPKPGEGTAFDANMLFKPLLQNMMIFGVVCSTKA